MSNSQLEINLQCIETATGLMQRYQLKSGVGLLGKIQVFSLIQYQNLRLRSGAIFVSVSKASPNRVTTNISHLQGTQI